MVVREVSGGIMSCCMRPTKGTSMLLKVQLCVVSKNFDAIEVVVNCQLSFPTFVTGGNEGLFLVKDPRTTHMIVSQRDLR